MVFLPRIYLSVIDWVLFCAFIFKWTLLKQGRGDKPSVLCIVPSKGTVQCPCVPGTDRIGSFLLALCHLH